MLSLDQNQFVISWTGQDVTELRARYAVEGGQPVFVIWACENPAVRGSCSVKI